MAKTKMTRVIFVVLTACAAARAGPTPDTLSVLREWDPRPSRVLDFKTASAAGVMPSTQSAAPARIRAKYSPMDKFGEAYLKPRMMAVFPLENTLATADLRNPSSNPVVRDPATLARVQKGATRAIKGALKNYAVEGLGINRWTIRLTNREGEQQAASGADDRDRDVRVRFGVSHLAPRADLLIPFDAGRVVVGADARGNVRTIFEPAASKLRVAADYDVPGHIATVRLGMRF
jgi:hypothetical protein